MVFRCTASKDGSGYPLELQVFERTQSLTQYRLVSRVEVTLRNEQCLSQPVTFNVSLPFCQGNRVGIYVPDLDGLTGLGYRTTRSFGDVYSERELSTPPSVNETLPFSANFRALPLVSVAGKYGALTAACPLGTSTLYCLYNVFNRCETPPYNSFHMQLCSYTSPHADTYMHIVLLCHPPVPVSFQWPTVERIALSHLRCSPQQCYYLLPLCPPPSPAPLPLPQLLHSQLLQPLHSQLPLQGWI